MSSRKIILVSGILFVGMVLTAYFFLQKDIEPQIQKMSREYVPTTISFEKLAVGAGEEEMIIADTLVVTESWSVTGTLYLALPPSSNTNTIQVVLPPDATFAGRVVVTSSRAISLSFRDRLQSFFLEPVLAASGKTASVPPPGTGVTFTQPQGPVLTFVTGAFITTPSGTDAPDEVMDELVERYRGQEGGAGGDIAFYTPGRIVFRLLDPGATITMFESGNGGKGATVIVNDGTWHDTGIRATSIFGGLGGRAGKVLFYGQDVFVEKAPGSETPSTFYIINTSAGVGGTGGDVRWEVNDPELESVDAVSLYGGRGGGGFVGGNGGYVRYAAGKPIVHKDKPHSVYVSVFGGYGGNGGVHVYESLFHLPSVVTPGPLIFLGKGGDGGTVTAVAHHGLPGTKEHPDGYEPGPVDVYFGNGGNVSLEPIFSGVGGDGAGMEPRVTRIVGGKGGDGYSFCEEGQEKKGGEGGYSGHLEIRAGQGGKGNGEGGAAGQLMYEGVTIGSPGKGGDGKPPGGAGHFGHPASPTFDVSMIGDVRATAVEDHNGLRFVAVMGGDITDVGSTRDGKPPHTRGVDSTIGGDYVEPERVDGKKCGTGVTILPENKEGVYAQTVNVVAKSFGKNPITVTTIANFTVHMKCLTGEGEYCSPGNGTWTQTTQTEDGSETRSGTISDDGSVQTNDGRGFSFGDPLRSPMRFLLTPGYYCTTEGKLAFPWSLPESESAFMYRPDGSSEQIYQWTFSGSVAPRSAWPKRLVNTRVCCAKNPFPEGADPQTTPATYSVATVSPGQEGSCVSGPLPSL